MIEEQKKNKVKNYPINIVVDNDKIKVQNCTGHDITVCH